MALGCSPVSLAGVQSGCCVVRIRFRRPQIERHLNGCVLESFKRPTLVITDAFQHAEQHAKRKDRDDELIRTIMDTLFHDGLKKQIFHNRKMNA